MAIKGHTKIQLFNSKTGELEQEVNENNMVTNAVNNLLNLPMFCWDVMDDGTSYMGFANSCVSSNLPISTRSMGGVLVFKNKMNEDVDNICDDATNPCIGHAGDEYSGTDTSRGSYNVNESKALSNGYRHVWDFASDKANGEIGCICLTRKSTGNNGVYIDSATDWFSGNSQFLMKTPRTYQSSEYLIAMINEGEWIVTSPGDNSITLKYYKVFSRNKISLNETNDIKEYKLLREHTFSVKRCFTSASSCYVDNDGILRYLIVAFNFKTSDEEGKVFLYRVAIDLKTETLLENTRVELNLSTFPEGRYNPPLTSNNSGVYTWAAMKNYNIIKVRKNGSNDNEFVMVDKEGNFVKYFDGFTGGNYDSGWGSNYGLYSPAFDAISFQNTSSLANKWILQDGSLVSRGSIIGTAIYCYKDIRPYTLMVRKTEYSNTTCYAYLGYYTGYLATINNLATPVTKTNQQTMKITYDLVET